MGSRLQQVFIVILMVSMTVTVAGSVQNKTPGSGIRISREHAYGALMGVFVGDAAGATLESEDARLISRSDAEKAMTMPGGGIHGVGPGQVTDDSELAIALADGLIKSGHSSSSTHDNQLTFPADSVAKQYITWYESRPFSVGSTCSISFGGRDRDDTIGPLHLSMQKRAAESSMQSESNGALMRVVPLVIWTAAEFMYRAYSSTDQASESLMNNIDEQLLQHYVAEFAKQDALISHPNPVTQHANAAYAVALAHLVTHPGDSDGAVAAASSYCASLIMCSSDVQRWLDIDSARDSVVDDLDCITMMGHVRYGFTLAFHFLQCRTPFSDAILQTLQKGGDTDTNAAIVGGLLGALHGADAIPPSMKDPVLAYDCSSSIGRPRPLAYCPGRRIDDILDNIIGTVGYNPSVTGAADHDEL